MFAIWLFLFGWKEGLKQEKGDLLLQEIIATIMTDIGC